MRWSQLRLRTKTFLAFSGPILVLLVLTIWVTGLVGSRQVELILTDKLLADGRTVQRFIAKERERLLSSSEQLAGDFALKRAIATYDPATLESVAINYRDRIRVDLVWVTDAEGSLLADSEARRPRGEKHADLLPKEDSETGSTSILDIDDRLLQLVSVPVQAVDEIIGYLLLGSAIDDDMAAALQYDSGSHVSFFTPERVFASSWQPVQRGALFPGDRPNAQLLASASNTPFLLDPGGERFLSMQTQLAAQANARLLVLVQQSYDKAIAPLVALRRWIAIIGFAAVGLTLLISRGLAAGITAPIGALVDAMGDVRRRNFRGRVELERGDEIGFLATSFNEMVTGLERGEWIKNTFGRFVSHDVADAVLNGRVPLSGERREVTILFQDIRGFTTLSERTDPGDLLALLNRFFTEIVAAVEGEGGVVKQFTGDGVMALFGAPGDYVDHAPRAVRAALAMVRRVAELNVHLEEEKHSPLRIGIGIHTGPVVAGTIGPDKRVEYGVVGDAVNLASRIEGLTKEVGATILVSQGTAERLDAGFQRGRSAVLAVRGKDRPVTVVEILDYEGSAAPAGELADAASA